MGIKTSDELRLFYMKNTANICAEDKLLFMTIIDRVDIIEKELTSVRTCLNELNNAMQTAYDRIRY